MPRKEARLWVRQVPGPIERQVSLAAGTVVTTQFHPWKAKCFFAEGQVVFGLTSLIL